MNKTALTLMEVFSALVWMDSFSSTTLIVEVSTPDVVPVIFMQVFRVIINGGSGESDAGGSSNN